MDGNPKTICLCFFSLSLSLSPHSLSPSLSLSKQKKHRPQNHFPRCHLCGRLLPRPPENTTRIMWNLYEPSSSNPARSTFRTAPSPPSVRGTISRSCPYTRANQYRGPHLQSPTTAEFANFTAGSLSVLSREVLRFSFYLPTHIQNIHTYMHAKIHTVHYKHSNNHNNHNTNNNQQQ